MTSPQEQPDGHTKGPVDYAEIAQWRTSGDYLPVFMRDFHDQKELFKALQDVVERSNAKHADRHRDITLTWTEAHIYTVDIFLWVMAGHGYTLQKTRKPLSFPSIYDFVSEATTRARASMAMVLNSAFAKTTGGAS